MRRAALALLAALAWLLVPSVAHADAAGPTDYRTVITAIDPETPTIDVEVVGGDAFLRIEVVRGHEVLILGYQGEPYLRIDADGVVEQNRRSAATYENENRFGGVDLPDIVDNDAPPEWERVGDGGAWAWHDHRAHWMGSEPPIGLDPGEFLPPQGVPIEVDGSPVEIEVRIGLVAEPSLVPVAFGALIGIGLATLGLLLGPATASLIMLLLAIAATIVGGAQYLSLPSETGRLLTWWLLPALAIACLVVAIATYGRSRLLLLGLTALAALEVALWAFLRRDGLTAAILPTDLPGGFDRFVTAAALLGGAVVLLGTLRTLLTPPTA